MKTPISGVGWGSDVGKNTASVWALGIQEVPPRGAQALAQGLAEPTRGKAHLTCDLAQNGLGLEVAVTQGEGKPKK